MRWLSLSMAGMALAACDAHYRTWTPAHAAAVAASHTAATTVVSVPAPPPSAEAAAVPVAATQARAAQAASRSYYVPTQAEIESAAVGDYPADYEQLVRRYLRPRIPYPDEARLRFSREPRRAYKPGYSKQQTLFAWSVGAYVNAKNAQGQYTGEDFHLFYVVDGRIVAHSNVDAELRRYTTGR